MEKSSTVTRLRAARSGVRILADTKTSVFSTKKRLDRPWGPIQPPRQIVPEFFYVGHEVGHTSPSSTEVKNEWSCAPDPPTYLRGMGRDQV